MRGTGIAASLLMLVLAIGCTGGQETAAAEEGLPQKDSPDAAGTPNVNARAALTAISPVIPLYAGAQYRDDLTRRDTVMIRNQYGPGAEVYTLATDDSFPQVFHYYTTYLSQFRAFPAQDTLPPHNQNWRTLQIQLNQAMQDPFIPGQAMPAQGKQVILQVAETEAEPKTVIRYIVAPEASAPLAAAAQAPAVQPVAR
jgi:hypothetical protein